MCEKRASFELARKPTGSEYKMLTGGIYAMLPLPVEQVQYLYSADAIARAAQSAADTSFTLDELAESLDPDLFPCQPPVFDLPSFR
jgi:hypothetical protein